MLTDPRQSKSKMQLANEPGQAVAKEKSPDDICDEGGRCEATLGDARTLAANDSPDDHDVER
jgi:hypothetical protein